MSHMSSKEPVRYSSQELLLAEDLSIAMYMLISPDLPLGARKEQVVNQEKAAAFETAITILP
jgi:hypothetical protein